MELLDNSLENIMELKEKLFDDNNNETEIASNYYISCELFREIIEISDEPNKNNI